MKIGLISDVHATPKPLREALEQLSQQGAEMILCAGDIAGYGSELDSTIDLLTGYDCLCVCGNHDRWYIEEHGAADRASLFLSSLPHTIDMKIKGREVFMVHGSPFDVLHEGIRLRDETGKFLPEECAEWSNKLSASQVDILIVGHTHQVYARKLGRTLVVNPGSTCFNHTCMLISLPDLEVETYSLEGKQPLLSWNFGLERGRTSTQ